MNNSCKNLNEILRKENGLIEQGGIGVVIWRPDRSQEELEKVSVENFLSKPENCSGEWLIDGGWGGPPGPIKVKWDGEYWVNFGFPPWEE